MKKHLLVSSLVVLLICINAAPVCNVRNSEACNVDTNEKKIVDARQLQDFNNVQRYELIPDSYEVNRIRVPFFEGKSPYPIYLITSQHISGRKSFKIIIQASSIFFDANYDDSNGVVNFIEGPTIGFSQWGGVELEQNKLLDIIRNLHQIAVESDGLLQLIKSNSETRIAFKPTFKDIDAFSSITSGLPYKEIRFLTLIPNSYEVDRQRLPVFSGPEIPVLLRFYEYRAGSAKIDLTVDGVDVSSYQAYFNTADGVVSRIEVVYDNLWNNQISTNFNAQSTGRRIANIIRTAEQISFEKDGSIQFITKSTTTRVSFKPTTIDFPSLSSRSLTHHFVSNYQSTRVLSVIPGSYQVRNQRLPLFNGNEFPVILNFLEYSPGLAKFELLVRSVPVVGFSTEFNTADGMVRRINVLYDNSLNYNGDHNVNVVIRRLVDIIRRTEQIAFEKSGMIQFITENTITRVAFTPLKTSNIYNSENIYGNGLYQNNRFLYLIPDSYRIRDQPVPVFIGSNLPISISLYEENSSLTTVSLYIRNILIYTFKYYLTPGGDITSTVETFNGFQNPVVSNDYTLSQPAQTLSDLFKRVQRIQKEPQGFITFISYSLSARVTFRP